MTTEPRYVVRCSSGEWLVLDRLYCFRVVFSSLRNEKVFGSAKTHNRVLRREDVAREYARRLNAEHEAWTASCNL